MFVSKTQKVRASHACLQPVAFIVGNDDSLFNAEPRTTVSSTSGQKAAGAGLEGWSEPGSDAPLAVSSNAH